MIRQDRIPDSGLLLGALVVRGGALESKYSDRNELWSAARGGCWLSSAAQKTPVAVSEILARDIGDEDVPDDVAEHVRSCFSQGSP